MQDLRLSFILDGAGWAKLEIESGHDKRAIDSISYLSPALDDLILLGISIALDQSFAIARFYHEPGSTVLVAERGWWEADGWHKRTRLSAFQYGDYGTGDPNWCVAHETARDWVIEVPDRDTLAMAVLRMADEVKAKHGFDGYEDEWIQNPYPVRAVEALRTALVTQSRCLERR